MRENRKKILALSGSIRNHSVNESIIRFIADKYSEILDVNIYTSMAALPHFNPDLKDEDVPFVVRDYRQKIREADALLICTPEYVFSLPGVLKNAIEWTVSSSVFSGKPVGLIVASGLGEKAYESLLLIMRTIEAVFDERTSLLIQGARGKLDAAGHLSDPGTQVEIDGMMQALITLMNTQIF